jgi:phosphonopyruvate decarboxylase
MGMGVAITTGQRTIVLDGDGAALMKLGALATIGAYQPRGLIHIILDNGVHDSTGGQATVAPAIDFASVALGCGYRTAILCDSAPGFAAALAEALSNTRAPGAGPVLIHCRILPGSVQALGRPTIAPHEVAQRFRSFLAQAD